MWKLRENDTNKEKLILSSGQHKTKLIARLWSQRDIDKFSSFESFLKNDYNDLSHPHKLKGVKEAANIFCDVALKKGRIAIIGDYDVDGVVSSVMINELSDVFGLKCDVFLPSRLDHGYGLNSKTISAFKERFKDNVPDLLFVVDCGSNNNEEVKVLREFGIRNIIIIDHHIVEPEKQTKTADVLVNWHLQDDFNETCACGQIFHFIRGIRWLTKKINPIEFISYAAIGILADVSPVIGDNRIIVKNGLGDYSLNHISSSGFIALLRKAGIYSNYVSQEDILFKIAPRINAVGRLHKPDVAFNLLKENDLTTAELMAENLADFNNKRKEMQRKIEKEAILMVNSDIERYKSGIVLYNSEWPIGIVGIVASRLAEKFYKPTLVIGRNGDVCKGSGRSCGDINLKQILDSCKDLFVNYGGHSMAAGITLKNDYIDSANEIFNKSCLDYYNSKGYTLDECYYYDCIIRPEDVNITNAALLINTVYPYCSKYNPEPVFLLKDVVISDINLIERSGWRSLSFVARSGDKVTSLRLRTFSDEFGLEVDGKVADIYISLPQTIVENPKYPPQVNVVDLVVKD